MNAPTAMLATLTDRRFSDPSWLFERKLDGVRALSERDSNAVALWSRNEKRIDTGFRNAPTRSTSLAGPRTG